jgi:TRAP-type transport system periplasmic protein
MTATRRSFIKTTAATGAAVAFGAPWIAKGAAAVTLRIGTLAPQASRWHKAFESTAREVKRETDGAVDIKIYAGGTMGDEAAMVRKMRIGQLDGAAVTSVGLGDINKQLLMLQLPLLFKSYKQLDYVRSKMSGKFEQLLSDEGFRLGSWGDVGFIYLFSNTPIKQPSDIKGTKMWVWDSDPVSKKVMEVVGVNAVPLGVPDVLPSLQTGVIDAFTNSPYAAIALQWYTKARYVTDLRLSMGVGASVITEKSWNKIPDDARAVLDKVTAATHKKLLKSIRSDNDKAVKALLDKGLKVIGPESMPAWTSAAMKVRNELTGKLFDKGLMSEMLGHLKKA